MKGNRASEKKSGLVLPDKKTKTARNIKDFITLFYGPPGVGKTTFVNSLSPRVLFLSTDRGTRFLSSLRVEIASYPDLEKVLNALEQPESKGKYDMVCIDHVDDFAILLEAHVCQQRGIEDLADAKWGKGWKAYRKEIDQMVKRLIRLDIGVSFIAHEEVKTIKGRSIELDRTMPAMPKAAWKVIIPLCDLVGFCGFKTIKKEGGGRKEIRILDTTPREDLYAKDRTQRERPEGRTWESLDPEKFLASFKEQ